MVHEGIEEATYGIKHQRFLQDFWLYGSRDAMAVALEAPLQRLLTFGREAAAFMACATCHARPSSISPRGKVGESCCRRHAKNTPKYALHPVPETLSRRLNGSQCLPFRDSYGLLRVNTADSCFMVQARLPRATASRRQQKRQGLQWGQVDLAAGIPPGLARHRHQHAGLNARYLRAVASLYQRCFGLSSNASCPRTVGDRKLFSGPEAACLRMRSSSGACSSGDLVPAAGAGPTGFGCVDSGLAALASLGGGAGRLGWGRASS